MTWGITQFSGSEVVSCENANSRIREINNLFPVPINKGGTGATTSEQARANFNLETQVSLYHNISGTTGSITLPQKASSCNRWGIYYGYANIGGYQEIDFGVMTIANLYITYLSLANNLYTRSALATANKSARTLTMTRNKSFVLHANGTKTVADENLLIYHVVGYI